MSNVKPGDMARVLPPMHAAGSICQVLRPVNDLEAFLIMRTIAEHGPCWVIKVFTGAPAVNGFGEGIYIMPGQEAICPDKFLRRIDPEADPLAVPAPPQEVAV